MTLAAVSCVMTVQDGDADERVRFTVDGETLLVHDALENEQLVLDLDSEPDPQPALIDLFPLPVDRAVSFEAESVSIPMYSSVSARDAAGEFVSSLAEDCTLQRGSYCFDVTGVTKALVRVEDVAVDVTGMVGDGPVELRFDEPTTVTVGGRSLHTRPEATITVPDDPEALMTAVSMLGSSIAEWSPERSWPTLRGYPPRIERGETLDVPSRLPTPDTGIEIAVPATFADVYRVAPLAYYLGADVVPGGPEIRLDTGYVERLPADGPALEDRVSELLRVTLFLDSLARTEGYVPSDRYEYEAVGPELPFYPPTLAEYSMSERLMEYLEVDVSTIKPYLPAWPTEAVLRPGPAGMELLGHLAHVLAPIRVRGSAFDETQGSESSPAGQSRFRPLALAMSPYLHVDEVPSPDAEPLPAGTAVLSRASYENYLSRPRPAEGEVHVAFVVDAAERAAAIRRAMSGPALPDGVGSVEIHHRPTAEDLAAIVADPDVDLLYCALPTDEDRVACPGGVVDFGDAEWGPIAAVCEGSMTVTPAASAVESGAVGALAVDGTLDPDRIRTLTGLLASGAPLAASVALARLPSVADVRMAGEPGREVVRTTNTQAKRVVQIRSTSESEGIVSLHTVSTAAIAIGAEYSSMMWECLKRELIGTSRHDVVDISTNEILKSISEPDSIIDFNGEILFQNDQLTEADIERRARRAIEARSDASEIADPAGFPTVSEE